MKRLVSLEIDFSDKRWRRIPGLKARLEKAARTVFSKLPARLQFAFTVNILLTSDAAMRRLNRDFRGMDKPTNVLSFPQFSPRELSKMDKKGPPVSVGDIALAYQYIVVEAKKDHKILINHITHLLIHGLLHLFGYDHMSDTEAGKMERLEKRIMAELGLPDPYKPVPVPKGMMPKLKSRRAQ